MKTLGQAVRHEHQPIGHLKFGPASDRPIKAGTNTLAKWRAQSEHEYLLRHHAISILNMDDEALEERMRTRIGGANMVETFLHMADDCQHWIGKYKAGVDVLESVLGRILVVAERISEAPEGECDGRAS